MKKREAVPRRFRVVLKVGAKKLPAVVVDVDCAKYDGVKLTELDGYEQARKRKDDHRHRIWRAAIVEAMEAGSLEPSESGKARIAHYTNAG